MTTESQLFNRSSVYFSPEDLIALPHEAFLLDVVTNHLLSMPDERESLVLFNKVFSHKKNIVGNEENDPKSTIYTHILVNYIFEQLESNPDRSLHDVVHKLRTANPLIRKQHPEPH